MKEYLHLVQEKDDVMQTNGITNNIETFASIDVISHTDQFTQDITQTHKDNMSNKVDLEDTGDANEASGSLTVHDCSKEEEDMDEHWHKCKSPKYRYFFSV